MVGETGRIKTDDLPRQTVSALVEKDCDRGRNRVPVAGFAGLVAEEFNVESLQGGGWPAGIGDELIDHGAKGKTPGEAHPSLLEFPGWIQRKGATVKGAGVRKSL